MTLSFASYHLLRHFHQYPNVCFAFLPPQRAWRNTHHIMYPKYQAVIYLSHLPRPVLMCRPHCIFCLLVSHIHHHHRKLKHSQSNSQVHAEWSCFARYRYAWKEKSKLSVQLSRYPRKDDEGIPWLCWRGGPGSSRPWSSRRTSLHRSGLSIAR